MSGTSDDTAQLYRRLPMKKIDIASIEAARQGRAPVAHR